MVILLINFVSLKGAAARPKMYGTGAPAGGGRGMARGTAAGYNRGGMAPRHSNPGAMNLEEEAVDRPPAQVPQEQRTSQ